MKNLLLTYFLLFIWVVSDAQTYKENEGPIFIFNAAYGGQLPGGDLADRFGYNSNVGGGFDFINPKNWIFGIDAQVLFGHDVKEITINGLIDEGNFLFGSGGAPASVQLRERGLFFGGHIGKIFALSDKNPRSGIRVLLGAGLLQHKIRIQNDPQAGVNLLAGNYAAGYDRLTNGLASSQFIGYQLLSKDRRLNLTLGFEFMQGFTKNRRALDFDTRMKDDSKRLDLLNGFRFTWSLPFYLKSDGSEIFY